jgi:dUTP pyrophosphatase
MSIEVRYKLWAGGVAPKRCSTNAACFDLTLPYDVIVLAHEQAAVSLQIGFEPKDNFHFMMIYPRSSLLVKYGLIMPTSIIDADYRGPVHAIMYNTNDYDVELKAGMRVAQINMAEYCPTRFEQVEQLRSSERGENGIGSTGE